MKHDFQPLRLLILGSTVFLGRHIVEQALRRGYDVTLFNRGQSNVDLFPNVEKLIGDRDGDLSALEGGRWRAGITLERERELLDAWQGRT
jgi:2'-hydroxyisoflavone reductase